MIALRRLAPMLLAAFLLSWRGGVSAVGPYDSQVAEHRARLRADDASVRSEGIEKLGYLRAYEVEGDLIAMLADPIASVRREAAMALGWCGGHDSLAPLCKAMSDADWSVRQAAWISLTNLTGMESPFDAMADEATRARQIDAWKTWLAALPSEKAPTEVLALLDTPAPRTLGRSATASTTYKGPPEVVLDGVASGAYWQTKNVDPPQWLTIDLGAVEEIARVVVHQYGDRFVMTGCELATSLDGETFDTVRRIEGGTPVQLVVDFEPREARYVRITSFGSVNPTYPTTFFEVEVLSPRQIAEQVRQADDPLAWRLERGLRAIGVFGGPYASERIIAVLGDTPNASEEYRPMVRAGFRSLGRLKQEVGFAYLTAMLDHPFFARYAAEALGDFGDARAVPHLLRAYPRYAKTVDGADPTDVPRGDKMSFPSLDRMLETPYWIAYSLCRLPIERPEDLATLRDMAPLLMANLPNDHDTFFLYEPEVGHLITMHLMQRTGRMGDARDHAMAVLGLPEPITWRQLKSIDAGEAPHPLADVDKTSQSESDTWSNFEPERIASWLPAVCDTSDAPRLVLLLDHPEGWVRLNAAKALCFLGETKAIEPVAKRLRASKAEADYGFNATFKNEEFDDPAPRWREGLTRCLGKLGAVDEASLLVSIMNDERSVAEIRLAAAVALGDLLRHNVECGCFTDEAIVDAMKQAAAAHDFLIVRQAARDALHETGYPLSPVEIDELAGELCPLDSAPIVDDAPLDETFDAVVFIRGGNNIPNTIGTVEQADRWRSEYAVTDSGPAYRPGRNLYILSPPRPDGEVRALTTFKDGYVADPELSWDGSHVLFSHRGEDDPWWHVWRINIDGTGLVQLTDGPYHDVGPAYLPDGRIVFSSTRLGIRDEYHGYPCNALHVMTADGLGMRPIATNIGRDNEPAIMNDGRIVFSRLEVFYSRNKTELTLHAVQPDGSMDVVLYGPERREFWRQLDHGPRTPADGQESPLTHRVLRVTQPQAMPDGRIILSTQAGLTIVDPSIRDREWNIMPDFRERSYTTPWPLPDGRILCASTLKAAEREEVDLGLYVFDPATQELTLLFNDPATADFEPRPVMARRRPPIRPSHVTPGAYSGQFVCMSVFTSQEQQVPQRGRYVRLIEGVPAPARHSTHTNQHEVWKNHGGTFARVLGTAPLAPDGSFNVEAPADRLLHFQVLDSDRRVVGNQRTWIYTRPGERKSCVGCHETPHRTTQGHNPLAAHEPAIDFTPNGREFTYRAKAWFKGHLPDEIEERTRTVRSVNLMGRQ